MHFYWLNLKVWSHQAWLPLTLSYLGCIVSDNDGPHNIADKYINKT